MKEKDTVESKLCLDLSKNKDITITSMFKDLDDFFKKHKANPDFILMNRKQFRWYKKVLMLTFRGIRIEQKKGWF